MKQTISTAVMLPCFVIILEGGEQLSRVRTGSQRDKVKTYRFYKEWRDVFTRVFG